MLIFLSLTSIVLFILLLVSVIVTFRFAKKFFELEDAYNDLSDDIEESLDILETSRQTIATVAGYEVVSDEPFVRRVVDAVTDSQHAVTKVAHKLSAAYADVEFDITDEEQNG